jgi:hypothetical protein
VARSADATVATVRGVIQRFRPAARRGALAAAVLVSLTAACTTDGGDEADSTAPSAATAPEATEAPATTGPAASGAPATDSTDGTTPAPTEPAAAGPTEAPVVVPEALQFTAPLVGGGEFDGAAVAGTPTVFWFWAPT